MFRPTTQCVVLRPFPGPGGRNTVPGEIVEVTDNNLPSLVERRYVRPLPPTEVDAPVRLTKEKHAAPTR